MTSAGVLYLIPCPIAADGELTLSPRAVEVARTTEIFIVERAKTARHFIKSLGPVRPLQELTFWELPVDSPPTAAILAMEEAVKSGKNVGILSEAGCPGVADPGGAVVAAAHRTGVRVVPLVGPSSVLLALMVSGMNGQQFSFHGYLSPKRPELLRDLKRLEALAAQKDHPTQLFIETPYRSQMVVETAMEALNMETVFGMAQALTAAQEQVYVQPVRIWKKQPVSVLHKTPAVFMIGRFLH